jgi:integrase
MANITKRKDSYRIRVSNGRTADGKQIVETTTWTPDPAKTAKQNEKALADFVHEFEKKVKSGHCMDSERMSLADYYAIWKAEYVEKQLQVTTRESYYYAFDKFIIPELGHYKLATLRPLHIQGLYSKLEKTGYDLVDGTHKNYSGSFFKRLHAVLSSALNTAVKWELLDSNPVLKAKPPKIEKVDKINNFSLDEAQVFLGILETDAVPMIYKAFFNLSLFGGCRVGELVALRWSDVNFESKEISITKSTARTKEGQIDKPPKSKKSIRNVPLPDSVMLLLKRHKIEQQTLRLELGSYWQGEKDGHLFTIENGKQINHDTPSHTFKRLIRTYNKTATKPLPDITLHGIRHTYATLALVNGVDVKTVSTTLGHSDATMTLNIYAHALEESQRKAADTMEMILMRKNT